MHRSNPGKKPQLSCSCTERAAGPNPPSSLGLGHGKATLRYQLVTWHRDHLLLQGQDGDSVRTQQELAPGVHKQGDLSGGANPALAGAITTSTSSFCLAQEGK